ncbi:hypothetical protein OK074_3977 [Actinobacteria bacterium OK074]|nr:hypothetical protein OK074_3977 [Actinobacteria bacterium OK074]
MKDVHDELRAGLRDAAEAYEPDRARILARVERGMARGSRPSRKATRPPVFAWARVVGATAAVAGVLAVGGYAVASVVTDDKTPAQDTVAVSPTPTPTPTPSPDATTRRPVNPVVPAPSSGSTKVTPSPTPTVTSTVRASGVQDGPLWSDGSVDPHSNDYWAQSNVTLKTSKQLTALTVRLRIAQTGGVSSAGAWRSLPEQDFAQTVEERDGFLVYTWVLKAGRTVAVGEWVFAGQYSHEQGGRDADADSYTATGTSGGQQLAVKGKFAAQDADSGADEGDS